MAVCMWICVSVECSDYSGHVNMFFIRVQDSSGHVNMWFCKVQYALCLWVCVSVEYSVRWAWQCVFLCSPVGSGNVNECFCRVQWWHFGWDCVSVEYFDGSGHGVTCFLECKIAVGIWICVFIESITYCVSDHVFPYSAVCTAHVNVCFCREKENTRNMSV